MVGIGQYFSNFHYLPHPKKQTIKQNAVIRFSFACVFGMIYLALIYAILVIKHFSCFFCADKNKSLEKETKQSYSEALSGWQHSVESKEEHLQKPKKSESERRERRYHPFLVVMIAIKDTKSISFLK